MRIRPLFSAIDWLLVGALVPLFLAGLVTMNSFSDSNSLFDRQLVWGIIGFATLFLFSQSDYRFLQRTNIITALFMVTAGVLLFVVLFGAVYKGAQSWLDAGLFSIQPSDPAKIALILILAKYFSRRHIEIAHIRHILVSALYALVFFVLVFLQGDFGSAVILGIIWLGMILISGISKKHLAGAALLALLVAGVFWTTLFEEYQRERIVSFIHPLTDIQGAGYNAYQSTVAVGSGGIFGKGVGSGSQSKLEFLPEYETDFVFAAFAEEWGFTGILLVFALFGVVLWRVVRMVLRSSSNFVILFGAGVTIMLLSHATIHIGMNIGLLPVTGTPLPFLSYGGSHLVTELAALGMLMGMSRRHTTSYSRHNLVEADAVAPGE